MKSSASESKPLQSRYKGEIPGRARQEERLSRCKVKQAFLIDSDPELFMYLIQCIRFGSWKVRRLNWAYKLNSYTLFHVTRTRSEILWQRRLFKDITVLIKGRAFKSKQRSGIGIEVINLLIISWKEKVNSLSNNSVKMLNGWTAMINNFIKSNKINF